MTMTTQTYKPPKPAIVLVDPITGKSALVLFYIINSCVIDKFTYFICDITFPFI